MHTFVFKLVGGVFKLELFLPEEYPMAAPKVLHYSFSLISVHCVIHVICFALLFMIWDWIPKDIKSMVLKLNFKLLSLPAYSFYWSNLFFSCSNYGTSLQCQTRDLTDWGLLNFQCLVKIISFIGESDYCLHCSCCALATFLSHSGVFNYMFLPHIIIYSVLCWFCANWSLIAANVCICFLITCALLLTG